MCLTNYIIILPSNIMQVINQLKIEEAKRKEFFLEILFDKYCRSIMEAILEAILDAIMNTPKSAIEVS